MFKCFFITLALPLFFLCPAPSGFISISYASSEIDLLKKEFSRLSKTERKKIQSVLKSYGFYNFKVDGSYGGGTKKALEKFNANFAKAEDLVSSSSIEKLLSTILLQDEGEATIFSKKGATRKGYLNNISPHKHAFALVRKPHPVRYGVMSEKFVVKDGDCGGSDCEAPYRYRSEITVEYDSTVARIGEDIWYGWSFFNKNIPEFRDDEKLGITIGQWKIGSGKGISPILKIMQLQTAGKKNYANLHWNSCNKKICNRQFKSMPNEDVFIQLSQMHAHGEFNDRESNWGQVCRLFSLKENKGKWVDIVLNTNFSEKEDGYLNIWINDKKKCAYRGKMIVKKDLSLYPGPSHRRGIFVSHTKRWDKNFPNRKKPNFIVYYDEFRAGSSREEVDLRLIERKNGLPLD